MEVIYRSITPNSRFKPVYSVEKVKKLVTPSKETKPPKKPNNMDYALSWKPNG